MPQAAERFRAVGKVAFAGEGECGGAGVQAPVHGVLQQRRLAYASTPHQYNHPALRQGQSMHMQVSK